MTTQPETWTEWLATACACNEYSPPSPDRQQVRRPGRAEDDSPGTDFCRRASWADTGLFDHGWAWERQTEPDRGLIRRPGKDSGPSASVGMCVSKEHGWPLFYCFSTSTDFAPETPYTKFGVYAHLNHGGDHSAAARALREKGYGRDDVQPTATFNPTGPEPVVTESGEVIEDDRLFKWMSELRFRDSTDKWLWQGIISRGGVTLFNALWKAGKSTMISHLLRSFDGRREEFLGLPITAARVLVVSEEAEEDWCERRDDLGIGDHVGMICRPFRARPNPAEWAAFLGKLVEQVKRHAFDAVIFDTISKLWPVKDENNANDVENALMPLWSVTNDGAGVVIVHHNRKTDGKDFTGSRGSGGLPSFAETIVELRRANPEDRKDPKRLLTGGGRYKETPTQLLIELTPCGYVSHGDPDDLSGEVKAVLGFGDRKNRQDWQDHAGTVLANATALGNWVTYGDLQGAIRHARGKGVRKEDLIDWLSARVGDGELEYEPALGNRPARWRLTAAVPD